MKAAVYRRYGPPEVVQLEDVPKPSPTADQVLIRVHATTVNRTDCGFRSAEYSIIRLFNGFFTPKHPILGCEYAGEIEAVGSGVTDFVPGDRVFGFQEATFGAHAEYIVQKASDPFARIPEGMTYQQAAPLTEGGHYALNYLRAAKIAARQRWLINGATGAIGSAAVQLANYHGAEVTAVCAGEHGDLVRALGACQVVDYTVEDFTKRKDRFDVVLDAVGKRTFGECKAILNPSGIYISTEFGPYLQNPILALLTPPFGGRRVLFPLPSINRANVEFLRDLAVAGKFTPLVDRIYPLEEIVEAYRYVETRMKIGNVLITV